MSKKLKKTIFTLFPIALGIALIWYSFTKLTPEDIEAIRNSFRTADYRWVFLSLFFGILSHISRAYRWDFMLEPMGYKPRFINTFLAVLVGYLVNLVVPRAGEIARASAISKYEKIPIEKAIGTIVSERIADVIMLMTIIATAFFLQTDLLTKYLFKDEDGKGIYSYLIIGALLLLGFIFYRIVQKSSHPFFIRIKEFINGLITGVMSIFKMQKKWAFIFHTVFIWLMYILMFWVVTFALPETTNLPFGAIIVGFVVGGLSMALTNGGLGTYPIFVASAITLYGVPNNPALAFGWIMWTAQTVMVLIFGGLSFVALPLVNKEKE